MAKDFPKLESPFIREMINEKYIVTPKIDPKYLWIFDKTKVIASEKIDGTNVSIVIDKEKITEMYNRENEIGILTNKKFFSFIDGVNYSLYKELFETSNSRQVFGELIGPNIQLNAYKEERAIWIPFDWLREHCSYKFWNKLIEEEIEGKNLREEELFEKVSNIFKELWSLYYRRKNGEKIFAEGIVFYNKETGEMCKLRRDMFSWYLGDSHKFYEVKAKEDS
ncbi:MAG: RNA ligase family protein [archaeon]